MQPQMIKHWLAVLTSMTLAASGCADRSNDLVVVGDSAGVTLITNLPGGLEAAAQWTVAAEPLVEIGGGSEPEVPLYRVTAVTPLPSGRVSVGMTTPPQAFVFNSDGTLLATLGREGEGPGEFGSVGSVVSMHPDSLAVWDPDRRRMSLFTEEGAYARDVDLSAIAPMSARASANTESASGFTHLLPASLGSVVVFGEAALGPGTESVVTRHQMPAHRIGTDGQILASYGTFPGLETSPGLATPFGARTHSAGGTVLVVGTAEAAEYKVYSPQGALTRIVRWPDSARTVGGTYLSAWLEMVKAEPGLGEFIEAAPRARRFPAYDDLVTTDRGDVLVAEYPGPLGLMPLRRADPVPEPFKAKLRMPAHRWFVFDSLGAAKASLVTPEGFEPYALREDILWGVYTDALDVESVRAYAVSRQ